jgi:hypothetical protein
VRMLKMTTRRWIFAVVIAATFLEGYREWELSRQYRLKARMHAGREGPQQVKIGAGFYVYSLPGPDVAAYHAAMRKKYERAATRPWKSVEPDPPAPK